MQQQSGGGGVRKILPPKVAESESVQFSLRMPKKLVAAVDKIAADTGYNRTEVVTHFVRWALDEYVKGHDDDDENQDVEN